MSLQLPSSNKEALLLIASGCAHCPAMLATLSQLIKEGQLVRLSVINITEAPEIAAELRVRSVPWTQIGALQYSGVVSREEILRHLNTQQEPTSVAEYIQQRLKDGELDAVMSLMQQQPEQLAVLLQLLQEDELPIQVRIGIGAIMEDFAGTPTLVAQIPLLSRLSESKDATLRGDATYYLALTRDRDALPAIQKRLHDDYADIREIAQDAIDDITADKG